MRIRCSVGKGEMEHTECVACALKNGIPPCGFEASYLGRLYSAFEADREGIHVTDLTRCLRKSFLDKRDRPVEAPHQMAAKFFGIAVHHYIEQANGDGAEETLEFEGVTGRYDLVRDGWLIDYKCQPAGELVTMADGTEKPIEEVRIFDRVLSLGDRGFVPARVTAIVDGRVQNVFQIKLASGQTIRCSGNHPILTDRGFVCARDIHAKEDRVLSLTNWSASGGFSTKYARLLGYLIGDGGTSQQSAVKFANIDEEIYGDVEEICAEKGWVFIAASPGDETDKEWRIHNNHKQDASHIAFVRKHGLYMKHSWEKEVPRDVLSGSAEAVANFIAGYFDCDGCVSDPSSNSVPPRITMVTTSEVLARQISELLRRLGISNRVGRFASSIEGHRARDAYHIMVWRASQIIRFGEIVPFRNRKKRERLEGWMPMLLDKKSKGGKNLSRVESVSALGPMQTIGIEVEGTHTYISNGIVTHNTTKRIYPHLLPYGEHTMQLNIYAWMIEQLGRPKIERIALVYIDNNGATQCSRCKTPVDADIFGGMSCPNCGSQPRDPHFGVKTIEVEKMPAEEIGRIFRDRKTILELAFETNQPPEGKPGWLCKWCPHECPFRQE